jgi:hypothetical protein
MPWLILTVGMLFALEPHIARLTGLGASHMPAPAAVAVAGILVFQFTVPVYGGYFGAGIDILMLVSLALAVRGPLTISVAPAEFERRV